jgi:prophage regulatory protein
VKVIATNPARYIRVNQLAKTPNSDGVLPMSRATIWRKVKNGTFPPPIKLSDNVTAWAMSDIENYLKAKVAK